MRAMTTSITRRARAAGRTGPAMALLAAALLVGPARAEIESAPVVTDRTRASLVADPVAAPGGSVPIALRLRLKPGWHTYWRNPGDSGEPPAVILRVGGREIVGPELWPVPERIDVAGIVSYGHHGDVSLITTLPIAATPPRTTLTVEAEARWLVCEKVCVPEQGRFVLNLPVGGALAPAGKHEPQPPTLPNLDAALALGEGTWMLRVAQPQSAAGDAIVTDAYFFPERGDQIDHSAPQSLRRSAGGIALELNLAQPAPAPPQVLRGVLAVTRQRASGARYTDHFQVSARPAPDSR
jgi:thiol:disulfide interchange protein DsbD